MKYLITGGAGFIGSHIVDLLIKNHHQVKVFDNFSTGRMFFIEHHLQNLNFKLVKADLSDFDRLQKELKGIDFVFHLAAHADVRSGYSDHQTDHIQNLEMTRNVLEAMFKNKVKNIAFTSTSSVYGDAKIHPTPENYSFEPTSLYGASKAACESYIYAFACYYKMRTFIFRLASLLGERYQHGIVIDVLNKLKKNSKTLELFSDGSPRKSSLYVLDGINAMFKIITESKDQMNIYNIGHFEILTVKEIVDTILKTAGRSSVKRIWLGKDSNWKGDNEYVHLSIEKLQKLSWKPTLTIKESIKRTINYLLRNSNIFLFPNS